MAHGKFVSYVRVSTDRQGRSGLGLDAQRAAIADFLNGGAWELLRELEEIESGKDNERPQLREALKLCELTGATLLIAKLDRLSRDLHFITSIMKAGIEFVACDMPTASKFTIHIYAALAEQERSYISERTRNALRAAKERGQILGKPENLTPQAAKKGNANSTTARRKLADNFAAQVTPMIRDYLGRGLSLRQTAAELNRENILTASGKAGAWTPTAVKNALARVQG